MKKYNPGTKGNRNQKRWKPKTKINWVMYRASFLKTYGILMKNWW